MSAGRWNLSKAPAIKRSVKGKAGAVYDQCVGAWRAGAIGDFYYGTRADDDPTIVWKVDGVEYGKGDLDAVAAYVTRQLRAVDIAAVALGDRWCGYQELVVVYLDGTRYVQGYNGRLVTVRHDAQEVAS